MPTPTYVFVLILENHSFDNLFAFSGIPGINAATTANSNSFQGQNYFVEPGAKSQMPTDPGHEFEDVYEQLTGNKLTSPTINEYPNTNNTGFASNYATSFTEGDVPPQEFWGEIMKGFNTKIQLPVLYALATEFALCDMWFSSMPGPTWPNRFFLHGASSAGFDHSPTTSQMLRWETSPLGGFTYPNGSIFDALKGNNIPWRIYNDGELFESESFPQVASLRGVHFSQIHNVADLSDDLRNGYTAQYTFIEPNYGNVINNTYTGGSSQHPMDGVEGGEALVKMVYEVIRSSPVWANSLLIITYDEHGGFYDSVPPPVAVSPGDAYPASNNKFNFQFDRYGVRVPAIVISPLISQGVVDHTLYDHSSVLATLERTFGIDPLTERDKHANDLLHLLTRETPRDCPVTLPNPAMVARAMPSFVEPIQSHPDEESIPQQGTLANMLGVALKTNLELSDHSELQRNQILDRFKKLKTRSDAREYIREVKGKVQQNAAAQSPAKNP